MIFEFLFVRHGLSCGNVWAKRAYGIQTLYPDPELTQSGIELSKSLSSMLIQKIESLWLKEQYSVCASQMIRAQETAFYMLSSGLDLPIHVLPHIGETGFTLDNYSLDQEAQIEIMKKRNSSVIMNLARGLDGRLEQTFWNKSNYELFTKWATKHLDFFTLGSDGRYRAVIFTHSNFLKTAFNMDKKIDNNEAIYTVFNSDLETKTYTYLPNEIPNEISNECPDGCAVSICSDIYTGVQEIILGAFYKLMLFIAFFIKIVIRDCFDSTGPNWIVNRITRVFDAIVT